VNTHEDIARVLFSASFEFDQDGSLKIARALGSHVKYGENDRFVTNVGRHRPWSNGRIVEELARAGAQYGPEQRDELMSRLPLDRWTPLFDVVIVETADFKLPGPPDPDAGSVVDLCAWTIVLPSSISTERISYAQVSDEPRFLTRQ
jgi:hypothetical protein